jgi:uncharacterized repeat protein (TIGR02543 family)
MNITKFTKTVLLSSSLLVLASCGSSSGSGGPDGGDIFKTGQFNAATTNTCTLTDASGATHTVPETVNGLATLNITSLPAGLTTLSCPAGGTYIDETDGSTEIPTDEVQRAATIYSGSGPLTLIASPLSEIAYGLADATGDVAASIVSKNTGVAEAFGLSAGFERVIPQDLNEDHITGTGDDATIGMILANLSVLDDGDPGAGSSGVTDLASLQNVANNVVGVTAGSFTNTNRPGSTTTISTGTVTTNAAPNISGSTSVAAGATTPLTADNAVVWESSDTTVATVDATGLVNGVASGTAVITATNTDIGALFSTITITVTGATAPTTYNVTYDGNTSTGGSVPTDSNNYEQGDTVTVLGNTGNLVKTGSTFAGWNTAANGSGTPYNANATFDMGSADVTLYAQWTTNPTYNVTYDGNTSTGGSVPTDSNNYEQGDTVTVLGNTGNLVKTGSTFAGWNTAANGSGTPYNADATFDMGSADVTLYAQWDLANPTITSIDVKTGLTVNENTPTGAIGGIGGAMVLGSAATGGVSTNTMVITGTNFEASQGNGSVSINGATLAAGQIVSWSDTSIEIYVPTHTASAPGAQDDVDIIVTNNGGASSSGDTFRYEDCDVCRIVNGCPF